MADDPNWLRITLDSVDQRSELPRQPSPYPLFLDPGIPLPDPDEEI